VYLIETCTCLKSSVPVDLSCVILSFNSSRSIRKCLESLVDAIAVNQLKAEILIVDNGSTDRSLEIISEISAKQTASPNLPDSQNLPDIKLHRLEKNYGTTASRNIALRQSTGKKILILDSDAYVSPEALRGLIDYLDQHPKVGLVAPKLIFPDGRPQLSTDQFPTVSRKIERVVRLRQIEKTQVQVDSTDVDYAISACWLLTREAFDAVGLLDEAIFYAPEDVDYCLRIWKAGFRIVYEPKFVVVHDAQERSRKLLPNRFTWLHIKGLGYYFVKHRYMWSADSLRKRVRSGIRL
jgi:GT2 family glycosyltransferase